MIEKKEKLEKSTVPINIILMEELVPEYIDLMKYPIEVEFAHNKSIKLARNKSDFYKLNQIPQEIMKRDKSYEPIAGKYPFLIVPIKIRDK